LTAQCGQSHRQSPRELDFAQYLVLGQLLQGCKSRRGQAHRQALEICQARGDQGGIAETLDLLGTAHANLGNLTEAQEHFGRAISLFQETNNKLGVVSGLASLNIIVGETETEFAPSSTLRLLA